MRECSNDINRLWPAWWSKPRRTDLTGSGWVYARRTVTRFRPMPTLARSEECLTAGLLISTCLSTSLFPTCLGLPSVPAPPRPDSGQPAHPSANMPFDAETVEFQGKKKVVHMAACHRTKRLSLGTTVWQDSLVKERVQGLSWWPNAEGNGRYGHCTYEGRIRDDSMVSRTSNTRSESRHKVLGVATMELFLGRRRFGCSLRDDLCPLSILNTPTQGFARR